MQFSASEIAKVIGVNRYGSQVETFERLFAKNNREMMSTIAAILYAIDEEIAAEMHNADIVDDSVIADDSIAAADLIADNKSVIVRDVSAAEAAYNENTDIANAISAVNKAHGIRNENKLYDMWTAAHGTDIGDRQKRFQKAYTVAGVTFCVAGCVDGTVNVEGADFVIELKSRIGHLHGRLRPYELPQFLFYMDMSTIPRCVIFEEKDGKTRETALFFDEYVETFQQYLTAIAEFIKRYNNIANNFDHMLRYYVASEYDRNAMLVDAKLFV